MHENHWTTHRANMTFARSQTLEALRRAQKEDVQDGGTFSASGDEVSFYTRPWDTPEDKARSARIGSVYLDWGSDTATIFAIEVESSEGFTLPQVMSRIPELFGQPLQAV
jgi:hypothetical protein